MTFSGAIISVQAVLQAFFSKKNYKNQQLFEIRPPIIQLSIICALPGDQRAVEPLTTALKDGAPHVRDAAAKALQGLRITASCKGGFRMRNLKLAGGFVGLVALLFSINALADGHEEDRGAISDVWIFAVKRGMEDEFTAAMTEHIAARQEMGEPRTWYGYRAEVGHHPGLVMYRSPPMSYADHDAYLASDFDAIGDAFNENIDPLVDHYHHYIESYDWEHSHWPDDETTQGPLFTEVRRKWKPGNGYASTQARQRFSKIALNDG